jgi:predicted glycosyltransferase
LKKQTHQDTNNKKLRVWIDITNTPHVLVFRPIIKELQRQGHEVLVTARDFAQTSQLLDRFSIEHKLIGKHQGKEIYRKIYGLVYRTSRLIAYAAPKRFNLAVSHGSNDCALASFFLRIPHVTMFDYEYAKAMHNINLRVSTKALIPDMIPSEPLYECGGTDAKIDKYPGLKEEYYLADFQPDESVLTEIGLDISKIVVVMRTPPDVALYHRFHNPIFMDVLSKLAAREDVQVVLLPRTPDQRAEVLKMGFKNVFIPSKAVDAQSLIYYSDLVISAGGTMNREAVALKTPVYTLFSGKMGAIDTCLIAEGRMKKLESYEQLDIKKKQAYEQGQMRDINVMLDKIKEIAR